jgi:ABC-type multidrug transport system fused ATPase/permease subunit
VRLSSREKQRIAIARAILKRPQIIVLDEATSAVDSAIEQLIQDAFRELCRGRTTFIVAHRLSTIIRADRILVIKDGEIIENGSHDELIHAKGNYTDLWSKQLLVKLGESSLSPRRPKNSDATIVNDVRKQKGTTTLATA